MSTADDEKCFHVTVKGLVFDVAGRVLLLREPGGIWDLPGGRLEHGETFSECLTRECREEMGVGCTVLDALPVRAWTARDKLGFWRLMLGFRLQLASLDFHQSDECVGHDFFDSAGLAALDLAPQIRPLRDLL